MTGVTMVWSVFNSNRYIPPPLPQKEFKVFRTALRVCCLRRQPFLLHAEDNLVTNLVMMYHVAVCFFIVYGMHSERDKEKVRRKCFMAKSGVPHYGIRRGGPLSGVSFH